MFFTHQMRQIVLISWLSFLITISGVVRGEEIFTHEIDNANVVEVRDAVIESIEAAGLIVSGTIHLNRMLERTGKTLGYSRALYLEAETIQFCSARLAWQLVTEKSSQLTLCPLAISVYATMAEPKLVHIAYRSVGDETLGRREGERLLRELVINAVVLAGGRSRYK